MGVISANCYLTLSLNLIKKNNNNNASSSFHFLGVCSTERRRSSIIRMRKFHLLPKPRLPLTFQQSMIRWKVLFAAGLAAWFVGWQVHSPDWLVSTQRLYWDPEKSSWIEEENRRHKGRRSRNGEKAMMRMSNVEKNSSSLWRRVKWRRDFARRNINHVN